MKSKLYVLLFMVLSLVALASCKTASKLYEKGNYDEAVELAAKKLQKDPDDPKLLDIIQSAYRYALDDHENDIRDHEQSNNELKWEWIYQEYVSLQKMYEAIYRVPSVYNIVRPVNFSSQVVSFADKAADTRVDRGLAFMQHSNKQSYRQAYREFQKALSFRPGDREITMQLNEAYSYAVTNVVILPMQQHGGYVYSSYAVGADNFDDQLIRNLQFGTNHEFVRFYSAWDARRDNIRVDQELELRLSTMDIGRSYDSRNTHRVSKDIVVKETVYKPDSVVKEYKKVFAEITTTRRVMNSHAVMEIIVRDEQGRWQWSDHIPADHSWTTEFASFTGDERALSETDKQLVHRRKEFAPTDNEIMRQLLGEMTEDAGQRIRSYFMRF